MRKIMGVIDRREFLAGLCAALCLAPMGEAETEAKHATPPPPGARVDINHASVDELMTVPGMTRSWAGRIIRFRPYRAKSDLVERGVVTNEVYARIKDSIVAHHDKP